MIEYITVEKIWNNLANLPQIVFEVTDACNLKCKYCAYGEFYDDFDKRENKMLPVSKAIRLLDYLNKLWESNRNRSAKTYMYLSFYGGEPLLNFEFIRAVVEYAKTRIVTPHRKILFSMTTNAILLHRYMDFLVEHDFHLLISLDGNEYNDSYRVDHHGKGSFERIVRNVDLLRERYPDYFEKNVAFNSVLHNRSSVESVYSFFKEKFNKIPNISELNNMGIRPDKQEEFNRTYKNVSESLHQAEHYEKIERDMSIGASSYKSFALYIQNYSGNYYRDYLDLLVDRKEMKYLPTGTCSPFERKMFVTVNGKILPCERIGHQFGLGRITDQVVELDAEDIARKYNEYYRKMERQCSHCKNRPACIQCLFNLKNLETHPICYGFMDDKMMENYKQKQMAFMRSHPDAYRHALEKIITL